MACNNCCHFHCGNSITVGETNITIAFADSPTGIADTNRFCFRICSSIPASAASLPVVLTINGASVALWNRYGDPITGSGLKNRRLYKGYYGATTPHVIVFNTPGNC